MANDRKLSLKETIYLEVQLRNFCPLDVIHLLAKRGGYKQSTSEKKCRELSEVGKIKPRYNDKGYVAGYEMVNCLYEKANIQKLF